MKLSTLSPKKIFRLKKSRSVSRSNPPSFSSGTTSSSSDSSESLNLKSQATPKSVLPTREITEDWSYTSAADVTFDLAQAFKVIDTDGDGKVTASELMALLSRLGPEPPSQEELKAMLSDVDRDGDGCISLQEFSSIASALEPPTRDEELRETFNFFDADHDGKITAEELLSVFTFIGDGGCTLEDCRRMISGVDKNGDGFVCFEDFSRMMDFPR